MVGADRVELLGVRLGVGSRVRRGVRSLGLFQRRCLGAMAYSQSPITGAARGASCRLCLRPRLAGPRRTLGLLHGPAKFPHVGVRRVEQDKREMPAWRARWG